VRTFISIGSEEIQVVETGYVKIGSTDGKEFDAFVAAPDSPWSPAIILLQELFGINDNMRSLAQQLAEIGYLVAVPDMFWRIAPRHERKDESGIPEGLEIASKTDFTLAVEDMSSTFKYLLDRPDCNGNIGGLGFCFGGTLANLLASQVEVDGIAPAAVVSYYGLMFDVPTTAPKIVCPMLFHFGKLDDVIPVTHANEVAAAFAERDDVAVELYDAGHAFSNWDTPTLFQQESAEKAWAKTLEFLKTNVG
jgi:carboxymethylenebutenolidase